MMRRRPVRPALARATQSLQQHIHAVGHSRKKKAVKNYEFARFALILIW